MGRSEIGKKKKRKGSSKLDEDEGLERESGKGTLEESACHAPAL